MILAEKLLILAALAFSCLYGLRQKRAGTEHPYFNAALCGLTALLLSRIYYLVIVLSNGSDGIFTVGTLGQASAYLFFFMANLLYLPYEKEAVKKLSPAGLTAVVLLCFVFIISAVLYGTVSAYIGEIIYAFCMGSALYSAVYEISRSRRLGTSRCVRSFNVCVCILAAANALSELAGAAVPEAAADIILLLLTIISSAAAAAMLPLLRKGMPAWEP